MARTIPSSLTGVVSAQANQPIELYECYLDTGTLYFAGTEDFVTFGVQTYTPIGLRRSPVQTSTELDVDEVRFQIDNVDLAQSARIIATDFTGRRLWIKKVFRENLSSASLYITVFDGRMDEPTLDQSKLTLKVRSWLDAMHHSVPRRVYSTLCNYQLYDEWCTAPVNTPSNQVTGTALGTSTASFIASAPISNGNNYWVIGTLTIKTGSNANLGREVLTSSADAALVRIPFPYTINSGDQYSMKRACRHTVVDCKSKFGNYANYGGFPVTPKTPII